MSVVEARLTDAGMHDMPTALVIQRRRHAWTSASEIDKLVADKNSIYTRVTPNVLGVSRAINRTVKGVALTPWPRRNLTKVNVVSTALLPATRAVRLLLKKSKIG